MSISLLQASKLKRKDKGVAKTPGKSLKMSGVDSAALVALNDRYKILSLGFSKIMNPFFTLERFLRSQRVNVQFKVNNKDVMA